MYIGEKRYDKFHFFKGISNKHLQGPYNEMEEDVTEYIHTYQRYSFKGKVA
jgi:hypothetical protein